MVNPAYLDLRGVRCPLPIVRLNSSIKLVAAGEELAFVADDPAFPLDVQAWARRTGHELVALDTGGREFRGRVKRCA